MIAAGTETALAVRDAVPADVRVYGGTATLLQDLLVGLDGCQGAEGNVCPNVMAGIVDDYLNNDMSAAGTKMAALLRLYRLSGRWSPSSARWGKMAMKVLGYPGGDVRHPYLMPPDSELATLESEMRRIGITDLENELAAARGATSRSAVH